MAVDKSKLKTVPIEMELTCYRCRTAPATRYRTMRTPNGSEYPRGWCEACLDGKGPAKAKSPVGRKSKVDICKLNQVPDGSTLVCYRCKDQPAVLCKMMRTPNGSKYQRGWCADCLSGNGNHKKPRRKKVEGLPTLTIAAGMDYKGQERDLINVLSKDEGRVLLELMEDVQDYIQKKLGILGVVSQHAIQVEVKSNWGWVEEQSKRPEEEHELEL